MFLQASSWDTLSVRTAVPQGSCADLHLIQTRSARKANPAPKSSLCMDPPCPAPQSLPSPHLPLHPCRPESRVWTVMLLLGTCLLYCARVTVPICAVALSSYFDWDKKQFGVVLSSFFWGYCLTQIVGGHISDQYWNLFSRVFLFQWRLAGFGPPQLQSEQWQCRVSQWWGVKACPWGEALAEKGCG